MDRVLNNEIDILNVANVDNDIRDFFTRAMISENVNEQVTATKVYSKGEYFIHNDRNFYKCITDISVGDTIAPGVNVEKKTISDILEKGLVGWSEQNILGAKNLLMYPYDFSSGTKDGIIYTIDDVGIITVSGTKTTTLITQYYLMSDGTGMNGYEVDWLKKGETYTLSGCPEGGGLNTYRLRLITNYRTRGDGATSKQYIDIGDGITFTIDHDVTNARLMIDYYGDVGVSYGELIFKPMIRLASIKDDTWVPYAMTNRKLTENVVLGNGVVKNIEVVSELPSDAASHTNTLYLVKE